MLFFDAATITRMREFARRANRQEDTWCVICEYQGPPFSAPCPECNAWAVSDLIQLAPPHEPPTSDSGPCADCALPKPIVAEYGSRDQERKGVCAHCDAQIRAVAAHITNTAAMLRQTLNRETIYQNGILRNLRFDLEKRDSGALATVAISTSAPDLTYEQAIALVTRAQELIAERQKPR